MDIIQGLRFHMPGQQWQMLDDMVATKLRADAAPGHAAQAGAAGLRGLLGMKNGWEEAPTWEAWCVSLTTCTWDGLNANAKRTTFTLTSTARRCSSHEFPQELLKSWQVLQKSTRMSLRGPTTWRDLHRNAWNGTANWQKNKKKKHQAIVIQSFQTWYRRPPVQETGTGNGLERCRSLLSHRPDMFFLRRAPANLTFSGL